MALLALLTRHSFAAMLVAVVIGLLWPTAAAATSPYIQPAVLMMLTLSLMRVDMGALRRALTRPAPVLVGLLVTLVIGPVVAAVSATFMSGSAAEGVLLNALAPPMTATPAVALLLGLDFTLALVVTVAATLLFPLGFAIAVALGGVEAIPGGVITVLPRILLMVGGPVTLAIILRRWLGPERLVRQNQIFDAAMVLLLLFFAVALMDGANVIFRSAPERVVPLLAAACLFNPVAQIVIAAMFWWWDKKRAVTLGLLTGNHNLGVMLAILAGLAGPDFFAYVSFAQIPIYTLPALTKFALRRVLPKDTQAG